MKTRIVLLYVAALAIASQASATWMACCSNGIAYTTSSLSGPWSPAGGCAGAPWMIQYRAIPRTGGKKVRIVQENAGPLPSVLIRQSANDTFAKPQDKKGWVTRLQAKGKP
jgi:hypothetical protein